jgi:hypothetical protein
MSHRKEGLLSERVPCEFFLIRYVPDVVKGEFVNIGVLLREATASPGAVSDAPPLLRFTRDWGRVRCIDADADIALLEGLEAEIAARLQSEQVATSGLRPLLAVLQDSLSNSIQITAPRACLAEGRALELEQLMRLYVEPIKVKQPRTRTGRAAIAAAMRSEFERAAVWPLMRKRIDASMYTRPGDPMKLDCGYRPNGVIRIFHAVSLANDVEAAKGLAYTAPQLHEGVRRIESATLELTAVVEPLRAVSSSAVFDDEAADRYRFGVEAMERERVRVLTVSDLARAAETARLELKL